MNVWAREEGKKTSDLTPTQTTEMSSVTKNWIVPEIWGSFLFIFCF